MDEHGMGSAALSGLRLFEMASRRSGRTTRMVAMAGDNDVIVCINGREAQRVERMLREKGKKTRVTHCPASLDALADIRPAMDGRCLPDHSWVYEYFVGAIERAERDLASVRQIVGREAPDTDVPFATSLNVHRRAMFGESS